jgi:hypothetical protein
VCGIVFPDDDGVDMHGKNIVEKVDQFLMYNTSTSYQQLNNTCTPKTNPVCYTLFHYDTAGDTSG